MHVLRIFLVLILGIAFVSPDLLNAGDCHDTAEPTVVLCKLTVPSHAQPTWIYLRNDALVENNSRELAPILHFHGIHTSEQSLAGFEFERHLAALSVDTVLLVPRSRGANKDFRKLVSTKSRFNRYFKQIEKALAARFGSSISLKRTFKLTAHSGGYIPAATVLTHSFSRVESAALFDALYRNKESLVFARFARAKPFFSIYRKNTRTERYNLGLLKRLQKNRHPSLLQAELTHVFSGCSASAVIAWTDDDHYDLVRLWYSSVLEWFTTL